MSQRLYEEPVVAFYVEAIDFDASDLANGDWDERGHLVVWCELGERPHRASGKIAVYDEQGEYDGEVYCCKPHRRMATAKMQQRINDLYSEEASDGGAVVSH